MAPKATATLAIVTLAAAASAHASTTTTADRVALRSSVSRQVRVVERAKMTLRFFQRHPRLLYASNPGVRRRAWHAVAVARQRIILGRATLARLRATIARLAPASIPHLAEWSCIHHYEGSWADPDPPYFGGLQMDYEFMATYGAKLLREKGTADHWTPREQMAVAERAWRTRGFWPWPTTARYCGLLG